MIQSGGFLGGLLDPLLKTGLPLISNVIKPLVKSVLIPLGLTAAASAADAGIHKKILGSGNPSSSHNTVLIISNDETHDIIKIVKSLEDSGLLVKGVTETVQIEGKKQTGGFLSVLLGTLGSSLLGNLVTGREIYRASTGRGKGKNRAAEEIVRAGHGHPSYSASHNKIDFLCRLIF